MRSSSRRLHEWPCRNVEADNQSVSKRKMRCQSKVFQLSTDTGVLATLRFLFAKNRDDECNRDFSSTERELASVGSIPRLTVVVSLRLLPLICNGPIGRCPPTYRAKNKSHRIFLLPGGILRATRIDPRSLQTTGGFSRVRSRLGDA
jgi:hypothetical protein